MREDMCLLFYDFLKVSKTTFIVYLHLLHFTLRFSSSFNCSSPVLVSHCITNCLLTMTSTLPICLFKSCTWKIYNKYIYLLYIFIPSHCITNTNYRGGIISYGLDLIVLTETDLISFLGKDITQLETCLSCQTQLGHKVSTPGPFHRNHW